MLLNPLQIDCTRKCRIDENDQPVFQVAGTDRIPRCVQGVRAVPKYTLRMKENWFCGWEVVITTGRTSVQCPDLVWFPTRHFSVYRIINFIKALITSMQRRMPAVVDAGGWYTKY